MRERNKSITARATALQQRHRAFVRDATYRRTGKLLDDELEKHRAVLHTVRDDFRAGVICANYVRRVSEILRGR